MSGKHASPFLAPGFYRTRNGEKALAADSGFGILTGAILDQEERRALPWHWELNGMDEDGSESGFDLVGPWNDEVDAGDPQTEEKP